MYTQLRRPPMRPGRLQGEVIVAKRATAAIQKVWSVDGELREVDGPVPQAAASSERKGVAMLLH